MVGRCVGEDGDACLEGWSVFGAEEVRVGIEEGDEVGWGVCCDVDVEAATSVSAVLPAQWDRLERRRVLVDCVSSLMEMRML